MPGTYRKPHRIEAITPGTPYGRKKAVRKKATQRADAALQQQRQRGGEHDHHRDLDGAEEQHPAEAGGEAVVAARAWA